MSNHTLNLFKIQNLAELDFSYKLVEHNISLLPGKEDFFNKQILKAALKVATLITGPTAIVKRNGKTYIAIPVDKNLEPCTIDIVPSIIRLTPLPAVYPVNTMQIENEEIDVIEKFLEFAIRRHLGYDNRLWRLSGNQFFLKEPFYKQDKHAEISNGITFRLLRIQNQLFICIDSTRKNISKDYISTFLQAHDKDMIAGRLKNRRLLYQGGDNWYQVEMMGFGKSLQEVTLKLDDQPANLYDYIINKTKGSRMNVASKISPQDFSVYYSYPGRTMEPHVGASSLAKLIFPTSDRAVRHLHKFSIQSPVERFENIREIVANFFQGISYNGKKLKIDRTPLNENIKKFPLPALVYPNGNVLNAGNRIDEGNVKVRNFGRERKNFLLHHGILTNTPFDNQLLLVPEYMEPKLIAAFKLKAETQLKELANKFTSFKVITYPVKENESATAQVNEIEKLLRKLNALSGFSLVLLPDLSDSSRYSVSNFHDIFKNKFYPDLKVQCASSWTIQNYFSPHTSKDGKSIEYVVSQENDLRFSSYLFYLAMEYLVVNRKWPYALSEKCNYDIYVGIDVHDRYAGFTFFFRNGERLFFHAEQVIQRNRSNRAEKLKADLMYKVMYDKLKSMIPKYCSDPNGIIILRDGRSFDEEEKALQSVVNSLSSDNLVKATAIHLAVIDLHKQSAISLRIAAKTNGHNAFENPMAGTYKMINPKEGFLFNTGYPFQIMGSAKPLHLSKKFGNANFEKIMEDVFCQSMLAFSAPDRSNALPITIKLIDTLLEPLTAMTDFVEENENIEEEKFANN